VLGSIIRRSGLFLSFVAKAGVLKRLILFVGINQNHQASPLRVDYYYRVGLPV